MNDFVRFHRRLQEKQRHVEARPVIYVAFGDSVTQGCMEYNTIEQDVVYHQLVKRELVKQYPNTILNVINSGVAGDTAEKSRKRWDRDLFQFQPDLVSIGFGVNDAHHGKEGLEPYVNSLKVLVNRILVETEADIVLITPNMMMLRENPNVHEADYEHLPGFLKTAQAGYLKDYVQALRSLALEKKLPLVDAYAEFERLVETGVDIHGRLTNGINHPDREFHKFLAERMINVLTR